MRKILLCGACLLLLVALPAAAQTEVVDLETALALMPGEYVMIEYTDEGRAQLEAAISVLRSALGVPDDLDEHSEDAVNAFYVTLKNKNLVNKLSQCYYTLADCFLEGDPNEEKTYLKGKHWGFKSLRMDPEFVRLEQEESFIAAVRAQTDVPALYWANSNWLRTAEFDKMGAIMGGVPPKAEAISLRLLELDASYVCYGPYRSLGGFWGGLPKLPFGTYRKNYEKARSYLCRVVDEPGICAGCDEGLIDPSCNEYFENRLFFVEFYLMEKDLWEDAKRILEEVLAEPVGEKFPLYNAIAHEKAAKFLEEVTKHL